MKTHERFHDKVLSLVFDGQRDFVLNMARVTHIDSTGIGTLIAVYGAVARVGGRVVLANLTSRVSSIMTITKLATVFDVTDSEDAAVQNLTQQPSVPA